MLTNWSPLLVWFCDIRKKRTFIKGYLDPAKKVIGEKAISLLDHFQLNCKIRQITFSQDDSSLVKKGGWNKLSWLVVELVHNDLNISIT